MDTQGDGPAGHGLDRQRPLASTDHVDPSGVDREVAGVGFEQRSGELEQPGPGVVGRGDDRLAAAVQRPAGVGAESKGVIDESEADTRTDSISTPMTSAQSWARSS